MIKRRLKQTASFFCVMVSVYGSVMVCSSAVRSGLFAPSPAVLNHRKMIVMFTVSVM